MTEHRKVTRLMEYVTICKTFRARILSGAASNFKPFDDQINKLSKEGWQVKFSNITVVQEDPTVQGKEPTIAFYALMERPLGKSRQTKLPAIPKKNIQAVPVS